MAFLFGAHSFWRDVRRPVRLSFGRHRCRPSKAVAAAVWVAQSTTTRRNIASHSEAATTMRHHASHSEAATTSVVARVCVREIYNRSREESEARRG